jgi:uncharacterized protein YraI
MLKSTIRSNPFWLALLLLLTSIVLAACIPAAPPPLPTREPAPTFTPTVPAEAVPVDPNALAAAVATSQALEAQATQQAPQAPTVAEAPAQEAPAQEAPAQPAEQGQQAEAPTPEPPPSPTPPSQAEVVANSAINVRGGPGTDYSIIGSANAGQRFRVTGRNPAGDWWEIDYNGRPGWLFGQLVTPQNAQAVAIASNIPAPPPPTATPIPQPTPVPQPAQPEPQPAQPEPQPEQPQPEQPQPEQPQPEQPAPQPAGGNYEFNRAILQRCDPNAGVTYVNGTVYKNGQPVNGYRVAFSYAPDGPVVASIQSGPHDGYPGWNTGFYSHILQIDGPREGNWFFWVIDSSGQRISAIGNVQTHGEAGEGKCQQAIIDFDS